MSSIYGTTRVNLLFYGLRAPYFARGAVKSMRLIEPKDVKDFTLFVDGKRAGRSRNGLLLMGRDVPKPLRDRSFEATKMPYRACEITSENYLNLSPFEKVEVQIDEVNKYTLGAVDQEWTQLIDERTKLPLVRHVYNLVEEPEYVPPADAQSKAFSKEEREALLGIEKEEEENKERSQEA